MAWPSEIDVIKLGFAAMFHPLANQSKQIGRGHNYGLMLETIVHSDMQFIDTFANFPRPMHHICIYACSLHSVLVRI